MSYPGVPAVPMGGMPNPNVPLAPQAPPQQEKLDYAIEFLERVKVVYADKPAVYNQFLDIMKVRSPPSPRAHFKLSGLLHPSFLSPTPHTSPLDHQAPLHHRTPVPPRLRHAQLRKMDLPHPTPGPRLARLGGPGLGCSARIGTPCYAYLTSTRCLAWDLRLSQKKQKMESHTNTRAEVTDTSLDVPSI